MSNERKECCELAIRGFSGSGVPPFCPACGIVLKEDHNSQSKSFPYQCQYCCDAVGYRKISCPDESKSFCPNCGKKHGGEIRWPKGFMSCCC